jgi:hypothetical protein
MATVLSALQAYIASAYAADSGVVSSGEVLKLSAERVGSFGRPGTLVLEGHAQGAANIASPGLSHFKPDLRR